MASELPRGHAPLHRSLTRPILLGGLPEKMTVPLWVGVIGFAMILAQIWVIPIGVALHVGAAMVTRSDPHFFAYFLKAFHARQRLEP